MIRIIKADAYRLTKTKGMLVTVFATVLMAAITIISESYGSIGITSSTAPSSANLSWSLSTSIQYGVTSSTFLLFFLISSIVIVLGYEFSQKNYKNSLVSGVSHGTFILSKYITQLGIIFSILLVYFLTLAGTAAIRFGIGDTNFITLVQDLFYNVFILSFLISVVFSLANFLLIATHSTIISSVFIIGYSFFIQIVHMISGWSYLKYFDFLGTAQAIGFGQLQGDELLPYFMISLATIVLSILASTYVLGKQEL